MGCSASAAKDEFAPVPPHASRRGADALVLHVSTEALELLNEEAETESAEWSEYGGTCLETCLRVDPALGHSPIRLVDARYFARAAGYTPYESPYAAHSDHVGKETWSLNAPGCRPEPIKRRQALPAEAFISLRQLKEMKHIRSKFGNSLRILIVSHPWLQPGHCDPFAHNYSIIAQAVVLYLEEYGGNFGIFLDFMSLHQKDEQGRRTADEQRLFARALDSLPALYSHLHTVVFKVTSLPTGYPGGYVFSSGTQPNQACYADRGWCFFEASVANFKDFRFVIDLGSLKPDAAGVPLGCTSVPSTPDRVRTEQRPSGATGPMRICTGTTPQDIHQQKGGLRRRRATVRHGFRKPARRGDRPGLPRPRMGRCTGGAVCKGHRQRGARAGSGHFACKECDWQLRHAETWSGDHAPRSARDRAVHCGR